MADGNGQPTYSVSIPESVRERFKPWSAFADRFGLFDAFVADLKRLDHLLSHTPVEWGDPLRDWEHAGLRLFRGMTEHLIAVYAVHLVRRYVFVKDIVLRPDRPLGRAEAGGG